MRASTFFKSLHHELRLWRQDFHQNPEVGFKEFRTSKTIYDKLMLFGLDSVSRNIGKTGVVGTIVGTKEGKMNSKSVGLRADIDALPMLEEGSPKYKSKSTGVFHGCGHDGHTTMLLVSVALFIFFLVIDHALPGCHCLSRKAQKPIFWYSSCNLSTSRRRRWRS